MPTRGFSAKKEGGWRDLPAIFHSRIFGKKGSRVVRRPQREKHNKMSLKCVYKTVTIDLVISKYFPIQILVQTVNKFCEMLVKCLTRGLDGLFSFG